MADLQLIRISGFFFYLLLFCFVFLPRFQEGLCLGLCGLYIFWAHSYLNYYDSIISKPSKYSGHSGSCGRLLNDSGWRLEVSGDLLLGPFAGKHLLFFPFLPLSYFKHDDVCFPFIWRKGRQMCETTSLAWEHAPSIFCYERRGPSQAPFYCLSQHSLISQLQPFVSVLGSSQVGFPIPAKIPGALYIFSLQMSFFKSPLSISQEFSHISSSLRSLP